MMESVRAESRDRARSTQIGIARELRWKLDGAVPELTMDGGPASGLGSATRAFRPAPSGVLQPAARRPRQAPHRRRGRRRVHHALGARPELTAEPARQRDEPPGNPMVRYRSSGYQADITFDADGFVTRYQDYLERVG